VWRLHPSVHAPLRPAQRLWIDAPPPVRDPAAAAAKSCAPAPRENLLEIGVGSGRYAAASRGPTRKTGPARRARSPERKMLALTMRRARARSITNVVPARGDAAGACPTLTARLTRSTRLDAWPGARHDRSAPRAAPRSASAAAAGAVNRRGCAMTHTGVFLRHPRRRGAAAGLVFERASAAGVGLRPLQAVDVGNRCTLRPTLESGRILRPSETRPLRREPSLIFSA